MGISTKGFLHSEEATKFRWIDLINYIGDQYKIEGIKPVEDGMYIDMVDNGEYRHLQVLGKYDSYVVENYPEFKNTAKTTILPSAKPYIVMFSLGCSGNSDKIICGIVEHFGGGYFLHNDCDSDWEIVDPITDWRPGAAKILMEKSKIHAIKYCRGMSGMSLMDAKNAVEELQKSMMETK